MKFMVVTLVVGFSGAVFAATVQAPSQIPSGVDVDLQTTGSIASKAPEGDNGNAVRLIDLKAGTSCKAATPPSAEGFSAAPLGPDCAKSPSLSRIAYWRATAEGSLVMADASGRRVLEFAPGDGVMFESVYPASELITIVPVRS